MSEADRRNCSRRYPRGLSRLCPSPTAEIAQNNSSCSTFGAERTGPCYMALSISSPSVTGAWVRRGAAPARVTPSSSWRPRAIRCIGWDPEGILAPPKGGHIARLELKRRLEKDAGAREEFSRQLREEKERRRALRQSRVVPETVAGLVEYFLDTEARELEFEIARLRPRLNKEFFDHVQLELTRLRFAVSKTKDMEDRLIELEAMQKVLLEGTEAYDKMQDDLVLARERLTKILRSQDRTATLLDMVERNELTRSVLALLDENIASAIQSDQKEAAAFMGDIRMAMLKYMTV